VKAATALALAAIRFYQRFISPHKGYSCALRAATGGASCSAYGHAVIARFGLERGLGLLQRRLDLCGHVHMRAHAAPPPHPRLKYQRGFCDMPACDAPCDLACHGQGYCLSADTAIDLAGCLGDGADCGWPRQRRRRNERTRNERTRSSAELDATAERIRRSAPRTAPGPATPAKESSPAAAD
jgi:putative component of membrane protein insertase Oxa1/YidC/SpoIIIJ protein YidD